MSTLPVPIGGESISPAMLGVLYEQLRRVAHHYFDTQPHNHTLQPTALVNEALLKLFGQPGDARFPSWENAGHFLAVAATAMRHILVDHARAKAAHKRTPGAGTDTGAPGDAGAVMTVDASLLAAPTPLVDVLELNEAIDRLAAVDERASRVVVLRYFAGLTIDQTARVLGVSDYTVENDWRIARPWLALHLTRNSPPGGIGGGAS